MVGTTLDIEGILNRENMAVSIADEWIRWDSLRQPWIQEVKEIRDYVFATDTTTTSNKNLPWKNSTTLPKLCQIRDNLHANYMAALFPSSAWLRWEGDTQQAESLDKRKVIQSYMENKLSQINFEVQASQLVYDFIDYGNVFVTAEWVNEVRTDPTTGEEIQGYVGAKPVRISPYDIVFNPTAPDFESTPKIIRSIKTFGEIKRGAEENELDEEAQELYNTAVEKAVRARQAMNGLSQSEQSKVNSFQVDGFGNLMDYYGSGYVEILQFIGDFYDVTEDKFYKNHIIKVIDRSYVLCIKPNPSWLENTIFHAGWRLRPDNLYGMSPLSNLVGMQYRIDHLENLKADVFDMIAFPMLKISGYVEDFEYAPNERIQVGEEGDVTFMNPDVTALNADTQIQILEQRMEEMAGAPKQAMGFRTPGEKTAYEVPVLQNGSNRIFLNKASYLERNAFMPLINFMLELSRRNMSGADLIRTLDDKLEVVTFEKVTKEDITAKGKLKPTGASQFARKNNIIQNITQLMSSSVGQDPAVNTHISGLKIAQLFENLLDLEKFGLVSENVRVTEQMETQRLIQAGQESLDVESMTPAGLDEADVEEELI